MLSKAHRLSTKEFDDVMNTGSFVYSSLFLVRFNSGRDKTKISAVMPLKLAKTAVQRNYGRRKIYEAIQPLFDEINHGYHIVAIAKKGVITASIDQLTQDLQTVFQKLK